MMSKMRSMASIQVPFPHTVNLRISVRALISNLVEDRGRLFEGSTYSRGRLFEGDAYSKGGAYLIFPKSWPDMINFPTHHLRINTNISCLLP